MLLHLLHAHVMIVMLDSLLGVRCQLGFPFTVALLGFLHGVLLVVLDFRVAVRDVFMSVWN